MIIAADLEANNVKSLMVVDPSRIANIDWTGRCYIAFQE